MFFFLKDSLLNAFLFNFFFVFFLRKRKIEKTPNRILVKISGRHRSGTSWQPHHDVRAPERHFTNGLQRWQLAEDGTIWLEESHSLIKVDETASFHHCSREMILIYVDTNTQQRARLGRCTSWLSWNVRRVVSRRVLPPSLSDGNLWRRKDRKGVGVSNVKGVDG